MATPVRRIYYSHDLREECAAGMWRNVSQREREAYAMLTADLMAFPERFERAMLRAIDEWPHSCEAALTAVTMNQRAWLGCAGAFLATGSPEDAARLGWRALTGGQQHDADAAADRVIAEWRRRRHYKILAGQAELFEVKRSA